MHKNTCMRYWDMNMKLLGYRKVHLGVDKGNPQSYAFWVKNQFSITNEDLYIIMKLAL